MIGKKYTDSVLFYIWFVLWAFISPVLLMVTNVLLI